MNRFGRKIYFDKETGVVLVRTPAILGAESNSTIDQDFEIYAALNQRVRETVGVIQLEYGQYDEDFNTCETYRVNPTTLELEFSYPDPNRPTPEPVYRKSLSEEVESIKKSNLDTQEAVLQLYELVAVPATK
ncbi:hypothetical protein [Brevibacillus porteri]|uniref:Uncharacterized protein n=1 Tax=Brevibacillus porteri TaxID=2126350 RepID=A0ABX5FHR7_9BACL|nr:hypothetical protein [Brevibacillus porteri]MED1801770.1 hypothetical protein [Brevibacillus porteri]MED2134901.1 hypothetical protein [Brevibacillus porteri]MED2748408.1 hypothetical protein [Brevibacillus porteri]MED2818332.1 hypothetical protein [Brevibacillus porteri]MED2897709.1 hypothetical protein [Brevibacillus porteri]